MGTPAGCGRIRINSGGCGVGWSALPECLKAFVVEAKQRQQDGNILFIPDVETDPSGIGQMMMRRHLAASHEFVAKGAGKGQVGHVASVEVADFPLADAKLASAETMRSRRYVGPTQQFTLDGFADFVGCGHGLFILAVRPGGRSDDSSCQISPKKMITRKTRTSSVNMACLLPIEGTSQFSGFHNVLVRFQEALQDNHFLGGLVCVEASEGSRAATSQPPPRALMSWTEAISRWPASWALARSAVSASRSASTTSI